MSVVTLVRRFSGLFLKSNNGKDFNIFRKSLHYLKILILIRHRHVCILKSRQAFKFFLFEIISLIYLHRDRGVQNGFTLFLIVVMSYCVIAGRAN